MPTDPRTILSLALLVVCIALAAALIYEIVKHSGAKAKLAHIDLHGHAPDGKVLMPDHVITAAPDDSLPGVALAIMAGAVPKGWHLVQDEPLPIIPQPAPLRRDIQPEPELKITAATTADSANPSRYFWNVGEALGLSGNDLVQFERRCAAAARGNTDSASLTAAAAFAAGSL